MWNAHTINLRTRPFAWIRMKNFNEKLSMKSVIVRFEAHRNKWYCRFNDRRSMPLRRTKVKWIFYTAAWPVTIRSYEWGETCVNHINMSQHVASECTCASHRTIPYARCLSMHCHNSVHMTFCVCYALLLKRFRCIFILKFYSRACWTRSMIQRPTD